jgi:hypothetical protein
MILGETTTVDSYGNDLKNLIFMGCFFLALIGVAIWWLRR